MAPSKRTMLFVCLLVAAVAVVVPIAQGQTTGGPVGPLRGVIRIQGTVFCSVNGSATVGTNGTILTPAFANATVQLRCGAGNGTVFGSAQTNSNGMFSILLDGSYFIPAQILSGCRAVVTTPLVSCNATLASAGTLTFTLTSLGNTTVGPLPIFIIGISGMFNSTNITIN
ncbi:phylloplanin-like [Rosa rugosa]|uniref:phylloplanin-like n=1 Tax=Rosa rugosa TaxID=74645 RepID=UPI002B408A47|nr:phylloplanin-like [Rosa rugosa]